MLKIAEIVFRMNFFFMYIGTVSKSRSPRYWQKGDKITAISMNNGAQAIDENKIPVKGEKENLLPDLGKTS
jgi:hypothetical protein